ncbi:MAG: YeeE/YedE thiosulfate transporter family protein [Desulfuromonadaceae bacterium]
MKKPGNAPYWPILPSAFALAGIMVFIFASFGPPASSSGFVTTMKGFFLEFAPEYVSNKAHYRSMPGPGSWLMAFVLGMAIGGFIAGRTFRQQISDIPAIWMERFGKSPIKRYTVCFVGGFLILFGARLAGGCTLGLFLSGSTQLALSGIYFGMVIFSVAMLTAHLLFKNK